MIVQSIVIFFVAYVSTCTDDLEISQRAESLASRLENVKIGASIDVSETQDSGVTTNKHDIPDSDAGAHRGDNFVLSKSDKTWEHHIMESTRIRFGDPLMLPYNIGNLLLGFYLNNANSLCASCLKLNTSNQIDCPSDMDLIRNVIKDRP